MKIGIFTDSHYSSQEITCNARYNSRSLQKIKNAYEHYLKEGCELVVCLGDLIDTEDTVEMEIENLGKIAHVIKDSTIPTVCLMGNHDAFVLTPEQFYSVLGMNPPSDIHTNGRHLIFLDACYFKNGQHYAPGDSDWRDTFLAGEVELRTKLNNLSGDTYLFIHQNIDPEIDESHRIYNSNEVFDIIHQSGVVKCVFQGHFHPGHRSEHGSVHYITFPALCENDDAFFVFDI